MNYKLVELFSYSVGIGAIIGLIRIRKIDQTYYPFIVLLCVGIINEVVTTMVINRGYSNAINDNIYGLVESLIILYFFKSLGLFQKKKNVFIYINIFFLLSWVVINFLVYSITKFSSYYNIIYSFTIVLMSINKINQLISEERKRLIFNSTFLILIGFIAFFTYKVIVEIFWVYGLNASKNFRVEVYRILTYINLSVNLIYAIAVLWMPRKREYMLL